MYRPAGFSDSDESDCDGFQFSSDRQEISAQKNDEVGQESAKGSTWLPISGTHHTQVSSNPCSALTTSDLVLAIEAGDLVSVLSCLEVLDVNSELPVWGGGNHTPALLALARVQPEVLAGLVERGGICGGEGLLTLAGGVDTDSDHKKVVECARIVLDMEGEKVDCVQRQGMTPLMLASRGGCKELVAWLVKKGADMNRRDSEGWTALMFSVDRGMGEVARLLLDSGADPLVVNCDGQRAADIAGCGGSTIMQDIIESYCEEKGRVVTVTREKETVKKFTEMENVMLGLDLREYIPAFRNHKVGLEEFLLMSEQDMKSLGVDKIGAVKKLQIGQAEIHKADWSKSSLPCVSSDHRKEGLMLNTASATAMVANISQHTRYIKANFGYVRLQLRDHGERLLRAGGDLVTPHHLMTQVDGCSNQLDVLGKEVKMLRKELSMFPITKEKNTADSVHIIGGRRGSLTVGVVGLIILGSFCWLRRTLL